MLTIKAKLGLKTLTLVIFGTSVLLTFYIASAHLEQPIYEGDTIINVWWSHDASELVFQNGLFPGMRDAEWFSFDTREQTLTSQSDWPLFDRLNKVQRDLVAESVGENGLIFLSPNDRYIVHNRVVPGRVSDVVLTDSVTGESINLEIRARSITRGTDHFHVKWSENSRSLVIRTSCTSCTHSDGQYLVTQYHEDINAARIVEITSITDQDTGDRYFLGEIYDLSSNGNAFVSSAFIDRGGGEEIELVIWGIENTNVLSPTAVSRFSSRCVYDAVFPDQRPENLMVICNDEIVLYALNENTETVIPIPLTLSERYKVSLAPTGDWAAVTRLISPGEVDLHVISLHHLFD